jgi:hypothetical protein
MTRKHRRLIAWLSLIATLFSAVSPAMAAALLSDRSAALAQMLAIPAAGETPLQHVHAEHATHDHEGTPAPEQSPHTDHALYCSLCLNASSTVAMPAAPVAVALATAASAIVARTTQQSFITSFQPFFRSRAPPAL